MDRQNCIKRPAILFLICVIGIQVVIAGMSIDPKEMIVSDENRVIEIPFSKMGITVDISEDNALLGLWDGHKWNEIPYELYYPVETGNSADNETMTQVEGEVDGIAIDSVGIRFVIPYMKSKDRKDGEVIDWWGKAAKDNLDERIELSLENMELADDKIQLYLYYGNNPLNGEMKLLFSDVPAGTIETTQATNNTESTSLEVEESKKVKYYKFTSTSKPEKKAKDKKTEDGVKLLLGKVAAVSGTAKTFKDRGEFLDSRKFQGTGFAPKTETAWLPVGPNAKDQYGYPCPNRVIGTATLVVEGTSSGDGYSRYLYVDFNGQRVKTTVVSGSFYYSIDVTNILDNNKGENTVSVTVTTYVGYWKVDAYVLSKYTASENYVPHKSYFAHPDQRACRRFYQTGFTWLEFGADIPRGVEDANSHAKLVVFGTDYGDGYPRILRVYIDGALRLDVTVSDSFGWVIFLSASDVCHKDELRVSIVLTTYVGQWEVGGYIEFDCIRYMPWPDGSVGSPAENLWKSKKKDNTIMASSVALYDYDDFIGTWDYAVKGKRLHDAELYMGFHFYIPPEGVNAIKANHVIWPWYTYRGLLWDTRIKLSCNGFDYSVEFDYYKSEPQGSGEDEMGYLLATMTIDIAQVISKFSPVGIPDIAWDVAQTWTRYTYITNGPTDYATTVSESGQEKPYIFFVKTLPDVVDGTVGRMAAYEKDIESGCYTFTVDIDAGVAVWMNSWGYSVTLDVLRFHETFSVQAWMYGSV